MGIFILLTVGAATCGFVGTLVLCHRLMRPERKAYAYALARGLATDPSELGLCGQETTFRFKDGVNSCGWLIEGNAPDAPVIIVTHGWGSSRYTSLHRAALLCRFASSVVVYDLRGHGDSTTRISHLGTTEAMDLLQIMRQVPNDDRPLVLFGSSLGAGASIAAASHAPPGQVAAVIAEAPYRHGVEPIAGLLRCHRYPSFPFTWLSGLYLTLRLRCLSSAYDRVKHAARLQCPLLVLHGDSDPLCKVGSGRQVAAAAPLGEFIKFEGAGHGDLSRHDPQRYLDVIERFLEKVSRVHRGQDAQPVPASCLAARGAVA